MKQKSGVVVIGVLVAVLTVCATLALGDVIHLKDGRKLEGKIVSETEEKVRIKMQYGEMVVDRGDIEKIVKELKPENAPETEKSDKETSSNEGEKSSDTTTDNADSVEVEKLKAIIEAKDRYIKRLKQQIEELRKEISELKKKVKSAKKDSNKETEKEDEKTDESTIPFEGDEITISKIEADGIKNYIEKRFIIVGSPTVSKIYAEGYRGSKTTHYALYFTELNKHGNIGGDAYLYIKKSTGKSLVDAIVAAEKDGTAVIIRAMAYIVRRKFDSESYDLETELINWQVLGTNGKWSKWAVK